jgi:hypothetical protein
MFELLVIITVLVVMVIFILSLHNESEYISFKETEMLRGLMLRVLKKAGHKYSINNGRFHILKEGEKYTLLDTETGDELTDYHPEVIVDRFLKLTANDRISKTHEEVDAGIPGPMDIE